MMEIRKKKQFKIHIEMVEIHPNTSKSEGKDE